MQAGELDVLIDRLTHGDREAAEQVFLNYEPYLRMVVRRQIPPQLRVKLDSNDVIQSVWSDLIVRFRQGTCRFSDQAHLRAFLLKVTHDRVIDRARRYRTSMRLDRSISGAGATGEGLAAPDSRPDEMAEADELWDRMMKLCVPAHRDLLEMKRQGLSPTEIAERTGLHLSSIRRILADLARRLAASDK